MLDAPADIPEPQVGKKANTPSSAAVPAQEAQGAIRRAFPYEGDLRVRYLWSTDGFSRFRANWLRQVDGKTMIAKSLFLGIKKTADSLVVQNETVVR